MDQYTRYYVNQSGGCGGIGPVYRASFRVQRGNGLGSFFRGLFRFVKPLLHSGAKALGKEALKTGSNIIKDVLNIEPEQPVGNIFKNRFQEAKDNLQEKIKNMTVSGLGLKRKSKFEKVQSQSERRKVKDIFTKDEKNRKKNKKWSA
jgi:hypothetical protein